MTDVIPGTKVHQRYYVEDPETGKKVRVPGSTTITGTIDYGKSNGLVKWANNLGLEGIDSTKYRDKAADIGTCAHAMVEAHLKMTQTDLSAFSPEVIDMAENALISYFEWEKSNVLEPILLEEQLVSDEYRYGGTIDCYGVLNGVFTLLDFKTGKGIYLEHKLQAASYAHLLREHNHPVEQIVILKIGRDNNEQFETHTISLSTEHAAWSMFAHARAMYDLKKLVD